MREYMGSALIVCRAHDGRKLSWTEQTTREQADEAVKTYKRFKAHVANYPSHRRRFAYRVNVYRRGECGLVAAYSFDPHPSLGRVLKVRVLTDNIIGRMVEV